MDKPSALKGKQDKVGADGLTKKERRALKVAEKDEILVKEPIAVKPVAAQPSGKLSEKEQRKLEWEKKLVEQKKQTQGDDNLSKAEIKQKRREQQEAQRQAKVVEKKPALSTKVETPFKETKKEQLKSPAKAVHKKNDKNAADSRKLQIVRHLYTDDSKINSNKIVYKNIHPAFVKLGVQYSNKKILGSNARCLALLSVIEELVKDLEAPRDQEFCRYLENVLNNSVEFLQNSRPFAVSMSNALRYFKIKLQEAKEIPDLPTQKEFLLNTISTYIYDEIDKAGEAISQKVNEKIKDGDVILTFACSSLIRNILLDAHKAGKRFQVVIVDGRPLLEGRQMLHHLAQAGIQCSYVLINAISYVMSRVTKVLLGAHALLSNGYVMSRIGTAQVALVAKAHNKPVLVCCETYKFSERVQTDSFVYNELETGDMLENVDTLEETSALIGARNDPNLKVLNLLYDVTPADLITAVVTEFAILPCSSAPVVLRVKPNDFSDK